MDKAPVYIVDIIGEVVAATNAALRADSGSWLATNNKSIQYVYGAESHVTQRLLEIGNSTTGVNKYPMLAMMLPISTDRGQSGGYYGEANLPFIYIATLSDNVKLPPAKYTNNFKPILFPIYYEFLKQLDKHTSLVIEGGVNRIAHRLVEYPADVTNKASTIFTDFLDILAITNLSFIIKEQPLISCVKSF